jgi:hypothetical protein
MSDPNLTPALSLLVPIHLDAFVTTGHSGPFKDLSPDLNNLKNYNSYGGLGGYIEKNIDQNNNTAFYTDNPGVHLHWILPKSFRHGVYKPDNDALRFPLAPNRWLIIRSDAQLQLKAWVVESDYIDQDATQGFNWMQVNEVKSTNNTTTRQYKPVKAGRALSLKDWIESNPASLFLQVIAPGDPGFAAAYLHSKNIFGFYDNMQDVTDNGPFTYRVYGWFSDPSEDPLNGLADTKSFLNQMKDLAWSLPGAAQMAQLPGSILCHATIHSISYNNHTPGNVPSLSDITLGIGNSPSEALGAMLLDKINGDQLAQSQKLLAAFQYQALNENGLQQNSLNVLKKEMHKRTFKKIDGGTCWVIEEPEKSEAELKTESGNKSLKAYTAMFSDPISDLLADLNAAQSEYNSSVDELKSNQELLYAALYKKNYANHGADTSMFTDQEWEKIGGPGGLIETEIANCKTNILTLSNTLDGLKKKADNIPTDSLVWPNSYAGKIPALYSNLVMALSVDPSMKNYQVKETPDYQFFQAAEPAVVINGLSPASQYVNHNQVKNDPETGNTTIEKDVLVCRIASDTANTLEVDFDGNHYAITAAQFLSADQIMAIDPNHAVVLNKVASLIQESLLMDPVMTEMIAYAIKKLHGDMPAPEFNQLKTQVTDMLLNFENYAGNFFNGSVLSQLPEKFSVNQWAQPWIPLYLEWGIQWYSTPAGSAGPDYLSSWIFGNKDHQIDYALKDNSIQTSAVSYSGRTILSSDMVTKVDELNKKLGGDKFSDLFQTMRPMSQDFSGLFSQLMTRYPGLQLPLLNEGLNFDADNKYLNNHYPWTPQPNEAQFSPLRSGAFRVSMLRVIDSFGQVLQIIDPALSSPVTPVFKKAAGLTAIDLTHNTGYLAPPRIIQPARIRFDWLSANIDSRITDADPATSPVCGWLLTNKLDRSIMVFDTDGIELGELLVVSGTVQLVPPRGGSTSKQKNERLYNLINGIKQSADNFNAMVKQLDMVVNKVQSKASRQQFAMPLPVGLPIAVAGARCTLQVKGLPATSQYWAASGPADFTRSTFKAYLGDVTSNTDGLVGYYAGKATGDMYLPFLEQKDIQTKSSFQETTGLDLQINNPVDITVLVDPRSSVTITSGILPIANYTLPAHAVLKPLQELNVRFLAAPVITLKKDLKVPLMKSQNMEWAWIPGAPADVIAAPVIPDADTNDMLNFDPIHATEGWLQLSVKKT